MIAIISIIVIIVVSSVFTCIVVSIAFQCYRARKKKVTVCVVFLCVMYKYMYVHSNFMCTIIMYLLSLV